MKELRVSKKQMYLLFPYRQKRLLKQTTTLSRSGHLKTFLQSPGVANQQPTSSQQKQHMFNKEVDEEETQLQATIFLTEQNNLLTDQLSIRIS